MRHSCARNRAPSGSASRSRRCGRTRHTRCAIAAKPDVHLRRHDSRSPSASVPTRRCFRWSTGCSFRPPALMVDPSSVQPRLLVPNDSRPGKSDRLAIPAITRTSRDRRPYSRSRPAFSVSARLGVRTRRRRPTDADRGRELPSFSSSSMRRRCVADTSRPSEDAPPDGAPVAVLSRERVGDAVRLAQRYRRRHACRSVRSSTRSSASRPRGSSGCGRTVRRWRSFRSRRSRQAAATGIGRRTYGQAFGLEMMVRRKPGVTVDAATADLTNAFLQSYQALAAANPRATPASVARPRAVAASILTERGPEPSSVARIAKWVGGVTVIVLLIACANVANLLLARTLRRRREDRRTRRPRREPRTIVLQLITEGVVLALLGGVAGLAVAVWGSEVLRATFLPGTERVSLITDARTLLFVGIVAIGVGIPGWSGADGAGRTAEPHE